jgi:HD superfamily phosphohydrolase
MHLSSYMLESALLNASNEAKNSFLKSLKKVIKSIIKEHDLDLPLGGGVSYFDNKELYQFAVSSKSKSQREVYNIVLQALRLAGLLHDVGHLPFSHQVEYALKKVYDNLNPNDSQLNEKELTFKKTYENITQKAQIVLHEAIANELIHTLFEIELPELLKPKHKDYLKLIHQLTLLILQEKVYEGFDFKVLHSIISSTVDADRLDYINRDMLASGYITGANDHIRITKQTILVKEKESFHISFLDMALYDIEHMLEMRFNLYKKVIFNYGIAKTDGLLENVVNYLAQKYFASNEKEPKEDTTQDIAMLWNFLDETNLEKRLDIISLLDENWLISLFKKEYFLIKNKPTLNNEEKKYLLSFEEVLFGKRFFKAIWKNLNELYKTLEFTTVERYKFRESFGYISPTKLKILQEKLDAFCTKHEKEQDESFIVYQIVSFSLGIQKEFSLYDGKTLISIDEISTLRKRLKDSMQNTVPFYLYTNKKEFTNDMREELKSILFEIFL